MTGDPAAPWLEMENVSVKQSPMALPVSKNNIFETYQLIECYFHANLRLRQLLKRWRQRFLQRERPK